MSGADRFPSYRAPQADREIYCAPPWASLSPPLADARLPLESCSAEILGTPLRTLARDARRSLLEQAQRYTRGTTDAADIRAHRGPLILTGHQPELIHPGVWLKNFAAARLATETGGTAVHLVIDSDLCRATTLAVPSGSVTDPQRLDIAYDAPRPAIPYEERTVADRSLWESFAERVQRPLSTLIAQPLLADWWDSVQTLSPEGTPLGQAIAQARHRLEQSWGIDNLELPQSVVCQTAPFRLFTLHLLLSAERVRHATNSALDAYRQAHRLRSPAQPLPNLKRVAGWTETPFWIWTTTDPTRRALYVQPSAAGLRVTNRADFQAVLPGGDPQAALQQLEHWEQSGWKIRSRALITTLYARLLLADTFIHGIGGAKYDQVTALLCEKFFAVPLPGCVTLSGTLHLPIEHPTLPAGQTHQLRQTLRALRYHPERYLEQVEWAADSQVDTLVAQKRTWVQTPQTVENAAQRHTQIVSANAALQAWLQPLQQQIEQKLAVATAQTRANQILDSREYAFCLFPQKVLRDFLLDFPPQIL